MREYAVLQTAILLRRLAFQVNRAAKSGEAEAIHDLRVAIRRFSRALRAFAQFFPGRSGKKVRSQLAQVMAAAASVRDLDIALELLEGVASRMNVLRRQIRRVSSLSSEEMVGRVLHKAPRPIEVWLEEGLLPRLRQ